MRYYELSGEEFRRVMMAAHPEIICIEWTHASATAMEMHNLQHESIFFVWDYRRIGVGTNDPGAKEYFRKMYFETGETIGEKLYRVARDYAGDTFRKYLAARAEIFKTL